MFEPDLDRGFFSRLVSDPVRLRARARWLAAAVTVLNGASSEISGNLWRLVYAFTWLCLPFIALAIGYGSAFFISHGREVRVTAITGIAGIVVAVFACVLLSSAGVSGDSTGERMVSAAAGGVLYGGLLLALSALVGFGLGKGLDYAGRRIEELDDEDW